MKARYHIVGWRPGDRYKTVRYSHDNTRPQPQPGWTRWTLYERIGDDWRVVESSDEGSGE